MFVLLGRGVSKMGRQGMGGDECPARPFGSPSCPERKKAARSSSISNQSTRARNSEKFLHRKTWRGILRVPHCITLHYLHRGTRPAGKLLRVPGINEQSPVLYWVASNTTSSVDVTGLVLLMVFLFLKRHQLPRAPGVSTTRVDEGRKC